MGSFELVITLIVGLILLGGFIGTISEIIASRGLTFIQKQWIKALRKNTDKQTTAGYLFKNIVTNRTLNIKGEVASSELVDYDACAIGIGVLTMYQLGIIESRELFTGTDGRLKLGKFDRLFPSSPQKRHWKLLGLNDEFGSFINPRTGKPHSILGYKSLVEMNDSNTMDFNKIASVLESKKRYIFS